MTDVVYISSLSHSGSTVFDLLLGVHPSIVGLGEVEKLVVDYSRNPASQQRRVCSCGKPMTECPFWSTVDCKLRQSPAASLAEKYGFVYDSFRSMYGEGKILVDSSKYIPALRTVCTHPETRVRVLFLIRDVRGYALSRLDNNRRKKQGSPVQRTATYHFWCWWYSNRRIQSFLGSRKVPSKQLSYEALTLQPEATLRSVCAFLNLPYCVDMVHPLKSSSHILSGNRMRNCGDKKDGIVYDNRWFWRKRWIVPVLLAPQAFSYNATQVYCSGDHAADKACEVGA